MAQGTGVLRIRRPSWRDPRLGVGILMVAGSVALGSWAISQADRTVDVFVARDVLLPGEVIGAEDLDVIPVHLGSGADLYVTAGDALEPAVVQRVVGAGEFLPVGALGEQASIETRPLAIPAHAAGTAYLQRGSRADLWVAWPESEAAGSALGDPELLVEDITVAGIEEDTALFAGSDQLYVQTLVPLEDLPQVLAALTSSAELTLIPRSQS